MLDSDLAQLYHIETGALNRQVKRNIERFPDDFCFQLSQQELDGLKCQIGRTNIDGRGGRRTLPWVFTEQGISMLSSVIHTDISIRANISIMRLFVKMRHYFADNAMVFQRLDRIELKQLEADEKFRKIFSQLEQPRPDKAVIFFKGQLWDATSCIEEIISKALMTEQTVETLESLPDNPAFLKLWKTLHIFLRRVQPNSNSPMPLCATIRKFQQVRFERGNAVLIPYGFCK